MRFRLVLAATVVAVVSVCAASAPATSPQRVVQVQAQTEVLAVKPHLVRESASEWGTGLLSKQNPDALNPTGMLIEVSIAKQRLTAWKDGVVFMSTPISTGMPGYDTPPGHFHVIFKKLNAWSAKWGVVMPWALNIHGNYFIHQVTHYPGSTANIGETSLGHPASHGCVRVGTGAAERLYHWARVGTPVWIH
jgi:lipoprotein-anchoring transpeptidase ErfK/SrfK